MFCTKHRTQDLHEWESFCPYCKIGQLEDENKYLDGITAEYRKASLNWSIELANERKAVAWAAKYMTAGNADASHEPLTADEIREKARGK